MKELLWAEKYRPGVISDCILPKHIISNFEGMVQTKSIPNLLLSGTSGLGKTTVARALCQTLNYDYMLMNSSDDRGIQAIRDKMKAYASTMSLNGNRKVIICDEADNMTGDAQSALRGFMEEFSQNCSFIFTCNFKNKIIDAIQSRCSTVDFKFSEKDRPLLIKSFYSRVKTILEKENIEYNDDVLLAVILKYFPDFRKTLNELQRHSYQNSGSITEGVLANRSTNYQQLFQYMRDQDYKLVREWVTENVGMNDVSSMYHQLYKNIESHVVPDSLPVAIIHLADYQYKSSFSADPEICLLACLTMIMAQVSWK